MSRGWQPCSLEVPGDRERPGVQTISGQLAAQLDHPLAYLVGGRKWIGSWTARAWLERVEAALAVAGQQTPEIPTGEPILDSDLCAPVIGLTRGELAVLTFDVDDDEVTDALAALIVR
jgi:hypothetical protein